MILDEQITLALVRLFLSARLLLHFQPRQHPPQPTTVITLQQRTTLETFDVT